MSKAENEQAYWAFSYRPLKNSADGELMDYLNSIPKKQSKDMAIQAIRAYWRVTAAMDLGDKTDEEIRILGLTCCNMLESQSDYIRSMLLLPPRVTHTIVSSNGHNMNPAPVSSNSSMGGVGENIPKTPEKDLKSEDDESIAEINSDLMNF